jgi:TolB protein
MLKRSFLIGLCVAVASVCFAQKAQIVKSGEGKIAINLGSFRTGSDTAAQTFLSVLKADLNRSGYFTVTSGGGALNVVGSCATQGGQVQVKCQVFNSSTRAGVFGRSYSGTTADIRRLAHTVADDLVLAITGKPGMASAKMALVSSRTGRKELYVCDIDGGNLRQLTNDRSIVVGPRWAPDGRSLIYTSYKLGYPNVFVTSQGRPVSSHGGLNASGAISPDGKNMALILSRDGNPELYVKSLRNGRLTRMTYTQRGNEASPCWSPDGRHIAFVSDTTGRPQVYVMAQSGGQARRITTSGSENVAPDWGKNGWIACSSRVNGRYQIAVVNPSTREMRLLEADWADYEDPSWAPDGRHIICSRTSGYRSGIYLLDTLKDSPVALISGSGDWFSPACSP